MGGHVLTLFVNLVSECCECFVKYLRIHINDPCALQRFTAIIDTFQSQNILHRTLHLFIICFTTTTDSSFMRQTIDKMLLLCRKSVQAVYVFVCTCGSRGGLPVWKFYSPLVTLYIASLEKGADGLSSREECAEGPK